MKKWIAGLLLVLIIFIYLLGPKPSPILWTYVLPAVPKALTEIEPYILEKERSHPIKPDNHARIIWADSSHQKTKYAVVYLHGFPASWKEGDPVHKTFASTFGCNLYLARLADQGLDTTDALVNFTVERLWASAKEALAIGNTLGDKVILMGTSTGSSLNILLAAHFPDKVHALINLSPNIELANPAAFLMNDPWGLQIIRLYSGGKYLIDVDDETTAYWYNTYRLEGLVQLERFVEGAMTEETFKKIHQPSLTLCYYKNEEEQDPTVRVNAMATMHALLSTPDSIKCLIKMATVGAHAMGSDMRSKDIPAVNRELIQFATNTLKMTKVQKLSGNE
jgi:pimeloyl-ACP methyl ester carboxylesterase